MNKKAFTLIELLVVVLIIGILAAIAVPQYQMAVEKSRYSTLKNMAKAIGEDIIMYEVSTGKKPITATDLDLSFPKATLTDNGGRHFYIYMPKLYCAAWVQSWYKVRCCFNDLRMCYYISYDLQKGVEPYICLSTNNNEYGQKVCQQETNKTREDAWTDSDTYLLYSY